MTLPFQAKFTDAFTENTITTMPLSDYKAIEATDLSVPYSSIKGAVADVLAETDIVTLEIDQLERAVAGAVETVARKIDRSRFVLDGIKSTVTSDAENPSAIFTDTFDTMVYTNAEKTTAVVHDGILSGKASLSEKTFHTTPELVDANTQNTAVKTGAERITVDVISDSLIVNTLDGVGNKGLVCRTKHVIGASERVTAVKVVTDPTTILAKLYVVDSSGQLTEVVEDPEIIASSASNIYLFPIDNKVATGFVCVTYVTGAKYVSKGFADVIINKKKTTYTVVDTDKLKQVQALVKKTKGAKVSYRAAYLYASGLQVSASYQPKMDASTGASTFQSKPIAVPGDMRTLRLSALQTVPAGTDVAWSLSINGSSFVNVMPTNVATIQSERLVVGADGTARFRFPVKAETTYSIVSGVAADAIVSDLKSGDTIIGIDIDGGHDRIVAVSYEPEIPETLDLSSLGLAPDAPSVTEARTDGHLGERFTASSDRRVTLAHRPSGTVNVYINGTRATELTGMSLSDPSLAASKLFFQVVGRDIIFTKDVVDVVVYYTYPTSTVVVKAELTATPQAITGPQVSSYSLSLTHV